MRLFERLPIVYLGLFVALPILMVLVAAWVAGTSVLHCQRLEPRQVDCRVYTTHWLGYAEAQPNLIPRLQSAKIRSYPCTREETINGTRQSVERTCEALVLIGQEGEVEPDFGASLSGEINEFLESDQREWLQEENNWVFAWALCGFACVWAAVGWLMVRMSRSEPKLSL